MNDFDVHADTFVFWCSVGGLVWVIVAALAGWL